MKIMHKNNIDLSSHVLFINHISRHFFLLEYFLLQKMKEIFISSSIVLIPTETCKLFATKSMFNLT